MAKKANKNYWVDNSLLENFKKIKREDILNQLFGKQLKTTENIYKEIEKSKNETTLNIEFVQDSDLKNIKYTLDTNNKLKTLSVPLLGGEKEDNSLILAAIHFGGTILSSDNEQINKARNIGIDAHGTMWIFKKSVQKKLISYKESLNLYDQMKRLGERLPSHKEFENFLNNN